MSATILEREHLPFRSALYEKRNRCIIVAANVRVVAESVEKTYHSSSVRTKVDSNLIIRMGEKIFHLHKIPMVSKSGYINRLVFQSTNGNSSPVKIHIDNLPGGSKTFESVVNFCYGRKLELTAANVAPIHCAAHFLEMTEDFEQGNLIFKTEIFLSYVMFCSWKDTFKIFKSCESLSPYARELQILKRCSEAVAFKARVEDPKEKSDNWWFKDLSCLRIDHFIEVITTLKRKGTQPNILGSCIAYWTTKWLSRISPEFDNVNQRNMTIQLYRVTIESLIKLLPQEEKSASFNFLLHLFKVSLVLKVDRELLSKLEMRLAVMLECCRVNDLLVKNCGCGESVYDVGIVVKVLEHYVTRNQSSRVCVVGRLLDEYLTVIAKDEYLSPKVFQLLVEALPLDSRYCHDNLYRAIDMYLKTHPNLTEEERIGICRGLEHIKLSQDALKHATKNDRLPLEISTRLILLEQVNMTRSITAAGSNYHRTKSQAIMRVSKSIEKGWLSSQNEIKMMKRDVEIIKVQLGELNLCRSGLQSKLHGGIV